MNYSEGIGDVNWFIVMKEVSKWKRKVVKWKLCCVSAMACCTALPRLLNWAGATAELANKCLPGPFSLHFSTQFRISLTAGCFWSSFRLRKYLELLFYLGLLLVIISNKYIFQTDKEGHSASSFEDVQCDYIVTAGYALCTQVATERKTHFTLSTSCIYILLWSPPNTENKVTWEIQTF